MSPNKRKIFASDTSDEDDSFKHRRSSLRVNLSHSDNLTDSGNGSFWKTEIENDERGADATRTSRGGKGIYEKTRRSDPDNEDIRAVNDISKRVVNNNEMSAQTKEEIQLKRLTINLEDISTKERYLETSCKHLKDAILCKSKQIFDGENDLSKKITMVLGNEENRFASSAHNPNIGNETVTLDTTDRHLKEKATEEHEKYTDTLSSRQREDQYSNIIATPTNSDKRRSLEKTIDKSKLTQRRLFIETDKQVEEQTKCRVIEDVVLKKNFPLLSLRRTNQSDSPILSGSNRRLSLFRGRSKLRSQNRFESHNNTYSTVHSVQNIDIGAPVVCSTFLEDNATDEEEINNDADVSRATHTMNKVVSMEMTEVYGGIRMSEEHVSLQDRNSDTNNCNKNNKEEKSKAGSIERNKNTLSPKQEGVERPINKVTVRNNIVHSDLSYSDDSNDQDVASMHIDTVIPMQVSTEEVPVITKKRDILQAYECDNKTKYQNERRCTISLSDSNNTIRSSLNVNTSLDAVTEVSKARNVRKLNDYRTNDANQDFETTINNKESSVSERSDDQHESVNTIRTSLQMNTSVDCVRKTRQRRNNKYRNYSSMNTEYSSITKNKETNDIDSLENISLIERLRNISMGNQISHTVKSRVFKMKDEGKKRLSSSGDSYSFVEGTPYPISRSVLFRSQLKYKTQHLDDATNCSNNSNSMDSEENKDETKLVALHSKVSDEMHMSTETQKITEANTVTLEDTPSGNAFVTQNELMEQDDADGTKSKTDEKTIAVQNTECVPVKKGRRRLLPLHENSQLCSITPIDEKTYTPEESTSIKRNKRLKKKLPKRKSMRSKNKTSNIKHNIASEQMWSDSDCDIPENKKKEKKTRKPKKVVSKKILIKKFVNENMLNILQGNRQNEDHSIENRDSLDDFVKRRNIVTISTQWNKYKSQKIVIVTTGLSKGDKSLVKSIVKSLGTAEIELNVSRRTTHVVSTGVRTVNLLRGIIRGCWLITLEWVLKSLENNAWLEPEAFEMKHFSKAVQENRKDRQLFGPSYIPELFTACGFIYVERKTTVPCDTLKELIKTAGGHITENTKLAKIIIGANGLKETWVIDSITTGELQSTKLYQRK